MPWWAALLDSLGLVAVVLAVAFASLFVRRRLLSRSGATFECSLRTTAPARGTPVAASRGWTLGVGRYNGDNLEWFRVFSFSPRPKHVFNRSLRVLGRRTPQGAEAFSLYAGHVVVNVQCDASRQAELAMSEGALTGLLAWTEAAPPGQDRLLA
ncbi:MAG: DUF2550 domain-containing protein [Nocardioidaceae bacterium]|nr:DUF2550 domain-containing protein [Nocardioidaceae bacterium]